MRLRPRLWECVWWLQMSFCAEGEANSAPLNPLAGFEGPLQSGGMERGERKWRKGTEWTGENSPQIHFGYSLSAMQAASVGWCTWLAGSARIRDEHLSSLIYHYTDVDRAMLASRCLETNIAPSRSSRYW